MLIFVVLKESRGHFQHNFVSDKCHFYRGSCSRLSSALPSTLTPKALPRAHLQHNTSPFHHEGREMSMICSFFWTHRNIRKQQHNRGNLGREEACLCAPGAQKSLGLKIHGTFLPRICLLLFEPSRFMFVGSSSSPKRPRANILRKATAAAPRTNPGPGDRGLGAVAMPKWPHPALIAPWPP